MLLTTHSRYLPSPGEQRAAYYSLLLLAAYYSLSLHPLTRRATRCLLLTTHNLLLTTDSRYTPLPGEQRAAYYSLLLLTAHHHHLSPYQESNALLATKLAYVLEKGLNCVFCIGEG